jgi:hypothetical protein
VSEYYDREGKQLGLFEWARLMKNNEYKVVAQDVLVEGDEPVQVSTIWLGLNMQFLDGPPLIFETMIFGGRYEGYQWRYPTEAAALAGHDQALSLVKDLANHTHDE